MADRTAASTSHLGHARRRLSRKAPNVDIMRSSPKAGAGDYSVMRRDFEREYRRATELLPEFGTWLASLLSTLLKADDIQFYRVDHRVKSPDSVARKLARPRKGMNDAGPRTLATLTDLLGLRIVTYFTDVVDDVAGLIEREFTIDKDNTVDKRAALDVDRFGYLSLHYVAELGPSRTGLPEYQKYGGIKFEIQIRSILQHAWAEIEHDLGYKSEAAVPRDIRRQFSRLAGTLELIDDAFVDIRDKIGQYQDQAQDDIDAGAFSSIEIDQDSLSVFVQSSARIGELDELIARARSTTVQNHVDKQFLGHQAEQLRALGFYAIEDLSNYLEQHRKLLGTFARRWLALADGVTRPSRIPVPIGITLYYAGALRYAQDMADGKPVPRGYRAHQPDLLRQALREAEDDSRPPR
jgi:putative GTP pyrophosphokinase